jgi:hypothetical protein
MSTFLTAFDESFFLPTISAILATIEVRYGRFSTRVIIGFHNVIHLDILRVVDEVISKDSSCTFVCLEVAGEA